ncbi:melanophilin isoform X2 [Protopterus annectens]|uniref:melanophilin isoform X2 n=1 Tax=Protopterus annectens TaxID=7888 RepID=UPI001CFB06AD|nr:melanophilin isoform X2 [Protopterus annectens]
MLADKRRKLDLSKLTDEEAQHVWQVIQRDFDLRHKEEERLGELKCKLEKEGTKRELLLGQANLNETNCVHCLQPFKFLVNSKRQCVDCHFYTCKSCSKYNKREQGWVCDPCRLSRILKIGSLEWYHEHVRSRFRRFGSAKVMRSLYTRLQSGENISPSLLGLRNRVFSVPNISEECGPGRKTGLQQRADDDGRDEDDGRDVLDNSETQRYLLMRRTKRLLSVHPYDFETDSDYSAQSRRASLVPFNSTNEQEHLQPSCPDYTTMVEGASKKESLVAEADVAALFQQILQERGQQMVMSEQEFSTEVHVLENSRRKSLEKSPQIGSSSGPLKQPSKSQYYADMDTSDDEISAPKFPVYQTHFIRRRSRNSSQENLHNSGSQSPVLTDADLEEETLRKKLGELAGNISDKEVSSEEEVVKKEEEQLVMSSSSDEMPADAQKVYMTSSKAYGLEKRLRDLEECAKSQKSGTTDSELSDLEGRVASTVAEVQQAESEVSDIESRIAALSAAGLSVSLDEKPNEKTGVQGITAQHFTKRKFPHSLVMQESADLFDRNSQYRGSLTQRTPVGKNKRTDRVFAKPVMTQRS